MHEHCADAGRSPSEIMTSTQLRFDDPAEIPELAGKFEEVACDLAILYVDTPHRPEALEAIATAIS